MVILLKVVSALVLLMLKILWVGILLEHQIFWVVRLDIFDHGGDK
jgi:hypothetical protein